VRQVIGDPGPVELAIGSRTAGFLSQLALHGADLLETGALSQVGLILGVQEAPCGDREVAALGLPGLVPQSLKAQRCVAGLYRRAFRDLPVQVALLRSRVSQRVVEFVSNPPVRRFPADGWGS